jgi:hypothetical protein
MGSIHKYSDIKINDINFSKPEKVGTSYFSSMSYGDNLRPLYIQTPKLKCLSNISEIKGKKAPYLEVEITDGNYDIYDFLLSLDDKNIKTTVSRSNEWFQREIPLEAIDDMYKRTTKPFKKGVNPTLRFKLPVIKNQIQCGVYNQQKVFIDIDEIKEGVEVVLILHIRGLKVLKQYFYCDCYVSQVKVFQENKSLKYNIIDQYSMIDVDENEDIFDQEILDSFEPPKERELKKEKDLELKKEKDLELKKEKDLELKKEKDLELKKEKIRKFQEEIDENRIAMETNIIAMEKLMNN